MSYPVLGWAESYPQNIKNRYVNNLLPTERTISEPPAPQNQGYYVVWDGFSWVVEGDKIYIGKSASASVDGTIAIGASASTAGAATSTQIAIGSSATASNTGVDGSIAIGLSATASGTDSIAIGSNTQASGSGAIAFGDGTVASGNDGIAIGYGSTATAADTIAIGNAANATVANGIAFGTNCVVSSAANSIGFNVNNASIDATAAAAPPATKLLGVVINGATYRIPLYAP